jgi:protein-L-isoaspartate O-methyltransferase
MWNRALALACVLALAACRQQPTQPHFPSAHRDVAPIVGDTFSTEDARDRVGEAEEVMELAGVKPGMSVADVGAGEGYYTVRLAPMVGRNGRVLAEDILPQVRDALSDRVQRENLENVAVKLGAPDNPMLPAQSFDRVFLVHMYHEVQSPYAFLWHLRDGVKPNGLVVVVDADRPVTRHGIPPAQLKCEFAALGMEPVKFRMLTGGEVYFMAFRLARPKPAPDQIVPCKS